MLHQGPTVVADDDGRHRIDAAEVAQQSAHRCLVEVVRGFIGSGILIGVGRLPVEHIARSPPPPAPRGGRRHRYATVVLDVECKRVVWIARGRERAATTSSTSSGASPTGIATMPTCSSRFARRFPDFPDDPHVLL